MFLENNPSGTFTQITVGAYHACGLRTDSSIKCWGGNDHENTQSIDAPSGSFTKINAGHSHTCGLRTDGSAVCWGDNSDHQL
jgi:alpha-tubulin suppressor-like RCC1 family protein